MADAPDAVPSDQLKLLDSEPGRFAYYSWKNILIVVWPNQGTGPAVVRLEAVLKASIEAHPEGVSDVHIIFDNAPVPTAEARAGFGALIKQYLNSLVCSEIVILGTGFRASAMRAAVNGIKMIAPRSFPFRIHSSLAEAARVLSIDHPKRTGVAVDQSELRDILETARTQHTQSPSPETK